MTAYQRFYLYAKVGDGWPARLIRHIHSGLHVFEMPVIPLVYRVLYAVQALVVHVVTAFLRVFWWTPLLKTRLDGCGKRLYLYGGMPQIIGPLSLRIGTDCRISGRTTFAGRAVPGPVPLMTVGCNVDIGWQTTIAVGRRMEIGDNVRIAGRCMLVGYPGHPVDSAARAAGAPDTDDQIGDIVLSISDMTDHSSQYPDPTDRASAESDRNFELRIRDRERKLLAKIG
ncbi:MAG: hypothetical protein U9N14_04095, partial [Pseudomonadota bacterium]|nr:hypothetical protein [Pseudomonadota bacterium]